MKTGKYYGQNGEDCVLWSLFADDYKGTYLDVGALDGKRFSNSYSFDLAGWTGVCAEAHPDYVPILKKNRPDAVCVHAAIADKDKKSVMLNANVLGTLSTLDASMESYFKSGYPKAFRGYKKIPVPMKTVNTILDDAGIEEVDVVSIDVEGTEIDVLKGFDLLRFKPKILVLEALDAGRERQQKSYMIEKTWHFARKLGNNLFFCNTTKNARIAATATIAMRKDLIHTDHPIKLGQVPTE